MESNHTIEELEEKKISELKNILRQLNLKVSGDRQILINRILENQPKFPLSKLPPDVLRVTALNLPLRDILNLCETNKQYQQAICNSKSFWEALFIREVDEKISIPDNADIDWYRQKLKIWVSASEIIKLIKNKKIDDYYISPFDNNWNRFEIIENLRELSCGYNQLTSLPPMPNLKGLFCSNNQLISLPPMPKLETLSCENNQLTHLPFLPNLKILYCEHNQLTCLFPMPNIGKYDFRCENNPLPNFTLEYWRKIWGLDW